ncbi:hypothetical protein JTE90_011914 [Oedothorax gibbosus]|uniref:Uncharacterized protein n=1 Tax=Oedothorax gibbosus TaxID=931172 RepID=A0AAV6V314_9ARAC|nr:hypothetical protein JTE90_011914 [Oedothorax gibbosus]
MSVCNIDTRKKVSDFICCYQKIHQLTMLTEQALSTQVFFNLASQFALTFSYLALWLGMYTERDPVFNFESNAFKALQSMSFFVVTVVASRVKQSDQAVRIKVKELAYQLRLSSNTIEYGNSLQMFMDSKEPLILTAWGIFKFTQSSFFNTIGILITYNLLLLQLESKTVADT